jgi:CspA family cold shock protein
MKQGTIVRIMDKGYGFIKTDGMEKDLFFHSNELQNARFDDLKEGMKVEFEVADGQKGPQAVKVTVLS